MGKYRVRTYKLRPRKIMDSWECEAAGKLDALGKAGERVAWVSRCLNVPVAHLPICVDVWDVDADCWRMVSITGYRR